MVNRYQIVQHLADGRFHSGEELAARFGVSRAAIWKHLSLLREQMRLELFSVRGRGYRLSFPLELLDERQINAALSETARQRLSRLDIHSSIDSTNSYLMQGSLAGMDNGHACLAEQQSAGKGRRGRQWVSPFGSNIYLSILWRYPHGPADLSGLSLAAGVAVTRTLEELGIREVGLKWPNDILCANRKLAGLLLEVAGEQGGPGRVVLGVGLNMRMSDDEAARIDQPWIDLENVPGGRGVSRNRLAAGLLENLLETMALYTEKGLGTLAEEWRNHDVYHGQAIQLQMGNRTVSGIHRGIDSTGALLLEQDDGIRSYHGGEVSLRLPEGQAHGE